MRRFLTLTACLAMAVLLLPSAGAWAGGPAAPRAPRGEVQPLFAPDAAGNVRLNIVFRNKPGPREALLMESRRGRVRQMFKHIPAASMEVPRADLEETLKALREDSGVLAVEPDPLDQRILAQTVPWGIERVAAPAVHSAGNRGAGVKVAVIDSGIDYGHPDLAANYKGGYDFVNNDGDPMDDNGHGTHVAGTLAAVDNTIGVIGVAPRVSLYALKTLNGSGMGYPSDFVRAVDWAIDKGIRVINYSAGGTSSNLAQETACRSAYEAGVTIVAAAGNDGYGIVDYPARYETVIAVGSVGESGDLSQFSNYGSDLDFVAPGESVYSTILRGGYAAWDGTSMAAPHVAAAAALLVAEGISSPQQVLQSLQRGAVDRGEPGWDPSYGWGVVNADASLPYADFIVSPTEGEILASGAACPVEWVMPQGAATVSLAYTGNGGQSWTPLAQVSGGISYDWTLPTPALNLSTYMVRALALDGGGGVVAVDRSVSFLIEVVHVDTPQAGEILKSRSTYPITWEVNGTVRPVRKVKISYSKDGGATWTLLASLGGASRSWSWKVPRVLRTRKRCQVRVRLADEFGQSVGKALSPPYFTIQP